MILPSDDGERMARIRDSLVETEVGSRGRI